MEKEKFEINYGLIVVDNVGEIYHFCGYKEKPTEEMKLGLFTELHEDSEFNSIASALDNKTLTIVDASVKVVNYFKKNL